MAVTHLVVSVEFALGIAIAIIGSTLSLMWWVHREVSKVATKEDVNEIKALNTQTAKRFDWLIEKLVIRDGDKGDTVSLVEFERRRGRKIP